MNPDAEPNPPAYWDDGTVEHRLPVDPRESIDVPWLRKFARLDPSAARERLKAEWSGDVWPSGVAALRDRLLGYEPTSLVIHDGEGFLKLEGPNGSTVYIGRPIADYELDAVGSPPDYVPPPPSALPSPSFHRLFPGLRDSTPGCAGEFVRPSDWETFGDYGWNLDEEDESWAEAVVVFVALNGDLLLIGERGVAWGVLARGSVRPLCATFDEFLLRYADFLTQGVALDSYRDL